MSPEQLNGSLVDHRSDVFGLGCVLYEVLTGRPAFGSTWPEVLARVNAGWVPKPSEVVANLHPSLERMTMRALAIDPGERYQDLEALAAELAALRREVDVEGSPDTGSLPGPELTPTIAARSESMAAAQHRGRRPRVACAGDGVGARTGDRGSGCPARPPALTPRVDGRCRRRRHCHDRSLGLARRRITGRDRARRRL